MQKNLFRRRIKENFFSIICATVGTENKLINLCNSLKNQNYKKFELIICDQNKKNFNRDILKKFKNFKIKFFKTKIGLSKSRNFGIKKAIGNFLIFLDDDITLRRNYLSKINKNLNNHKCDIICYKVNNLNQGYLLKYPNVSRYILNNDEIFNHISSVSFVIKNNNLILFDENLGLGSKFKFQSGEETDLILRAKKKYNFIIYFLNSITIYHSERKESFLSMVQKKYLYGCGWGYVVKKNKLGFLFKYKNIFKIFLNFIFHIITFNLRKSCFSFANFIGRLNGI